MPVSILTNGEEVCTQVDLKPEKSEECVDASSIALASDVFRIRSSHELSSLPLRLALLDNVCAIMPSAGMDLFGNALDIRLPFVSVNPEFLEKSDGEELLRSVFAIDPCDPSISPELDDVAAGSPWFRSIALRARLEYRDMITLSELLLERFKFQVLSTFRVLKLSASMTKAIGDGAGLAQNTTELDRAPPDAFYAKSVSSIMEVRSRALALRQSTLSMDAAAIVNHLTPFLENVFPSYAGSALPPTVEPENLFLLPIRFLVCGSKRCDYASLDGAVAASLKLLGEASEYLCVVGIPALEEPPQRDSQSMVEHERSVDQPRPMTDERNAVGSLDQPSLGEALPARKKKKKGKKRKVCVSNSAVAVDHLACTDAP
jgi:hypothetical protein